MPTDATSCCPRYFGVGSHRGRARQTAITLCRNGRPCRSRACPPAFARRDRAAAGRAPALPGDRVSRRPSGEFRIGRPDRARFLGLALRGIKMDRAVLRGANFSRAHLQNANLIGAILQEARLNHLDLSGARLCGANLVSASLENACLAKADMEFALMANVVLRGACLREADISGAQLDATVLTRADLRKANLRGAGFRDARLDEADLRDARLGSLVPGRGLAARRRFARCVSALGEARRCGSVRCQPRWRRRLDAGSDRSGPL